MPDSVSMSRLQAYSCLQIECLRGLPSSASALDKHHSSMKDRMCMRMQLNSRTSTCLAAIRCRCSKYLMQTGFGFDGNAVQRVAHYNLCIVLSNESLSTCGTYHPMSTFTSSVWSWQLHGDLQCCASSIVKQLQTVLPMSCDLTYKLCLTWPTHASHRQYSSFYSFATPGTRSPLTHLKVNIAGLLSYSQLDVQGPLLQVAPKECKNTQSTGRNEVVCDHQASLHIRAALQQAALHIEKGTVSKGAVKHIQTQVTGRSVWQG